MGFRVQVQGLGFRVYGFSGLAVWRFGVWGLGFQNAFPSRSLRVKGSGLTVIGFYRVFQGCLGCFGRLGFRASLKVCWLHVLM